MGIDYVLTVAAFLCFTLAAIGVPAKINLTAAGLALWMATVLI